MTNFTDHVKQSIEKSDSTLVVSVFKDEHEGSVVHHMGGNVDECFDRALEVMIDNYYSDSEYDMLKTVELASKRFDDALYKFIEDNNPSGDVTTPLRRLNSKINLIKDLTNNKIVSETFKNAKNAVKQFKYDFELINQITEELTEEDNDYI